VNGERRSYALLRPTTDTTAQDHIRDLVLSAYATFEAGSDECAGETMAYGLTPGLGQD
jgi:hypothetical protein